MNQNIIYQKQNEPHFIEMLAAQRQLYSEEKSFNKLLFAFSFFSAVILPCVLFYAPTVSQWWGLAGLVIFFITQRLNAAMKKKRETASRIQEELDTQLFGLTWNKALAGAHVGPEIIFAAGQRFKGNREKLQNWYSSAQENLPHPQVVLLCMRENFVWDYRQRHSYINWLSVIFIAILIGVLGLGIGFDVSLLTFLLKYLAPVLPLLGLIGEAWLSHRKTADNLQLKAEEITELLLSEPAVSANIANDKLRSFQDAVFKNRQSGLPVPDWYYRSIGKRISQEVDQSRKSIIQKLATQ